MKSTCKATGALGLALGAAVMIAPLASARAQTQDSSRFSPTVADTGGYSDSLVRPGYRALLEDTTGGLGADSSGINPMPSFGDTASQTGTGGGIDTTGMAPRRSEDSADVGRASSPQPGDSR
ncbi:MAG TPA: hypothetical protein VH763_06270 [Gemmatimonadales bacterium]|jgi:hypothetical protein